MNYTIKQIAEMAGVHRSTVDKVLHGRVGVSDEVRDRIQNIIKEVGYKPNPLGKALKRKQEPIRLAAVLLQVDAYPFIRQGIERAVAAYDSFTVSMEYHVVKYPDTAAQEAVLSQLCQQDLDGIILHPIASEEIGHAIDRAAEAGIPVITCNYDIENSRRLCFVGQNGQRAGQVAARLLGEFLGGRGEVAVITSTDGVSSGFSLANREHGFFHVAEKEFPGIQVVETMQGYDDTKVIFQKTLQVLRWYPNLRGIYVTGGGVAAVGRALRVAGKQKQIKVVCYEQYDEILHLLREGTITCTLGTDLENQGYRPVQILMDLLIYDKPPQKLHEFTNINILVKECVG